MSRSKRITEKIELDVFISFSTIAVLAIHHPCFLRVQLKPHLPESGVKILAHRIRLNLGTAVQDTVVSVTTERDARVMCCQPVI